MMVVGRGEPNTTQVKRAVVFSVTTESGGAITMATCSVYKCECVCVCLCVQNRKGN